MRTLSISEAEMEVSADRGCRVGLSLVVALLIFFTFLAAGSRAWRKWGDSQGCLQETRNQMVQFLPFLRPPTHPPVRGLEMENTISSAIVNRLILAILSLMVGSVRTHLLVWIQPQAPGQKSWWSQCDGQISKNQQRIQASYRVWRWSRQPWRWWGWGQSGEKPTWSLFCSSCQSRIFVEKETAWRYAVSHTCLTWSIILVDRFKPDSCLCTFAEEFLLLWGVYANGEPLSRLFVTSPCFFFPQMAISCGFLDEGHDASFQRLSCRYHVKHAIH